MVLFLNFSLNAQNSSFEITTKEEKQKNDKTRHPLSAVTGMAKTLPKNVLKVQVPFAYTDGKKGYDPSGLHAYQGYSIRRFLTGVIAYYGVTDRLSVGVAVPIILRNNIALDGKHFKNSELFRERYEKIIRQIAEKIYGDAGNKESFNKFFNTTSVESIINDLKNKHMPVNNAMPDLPLPTGEYFKFKGNGRIGDEITRLVQQAAAPTDGAKGIGDILLGFLYAVRPEPKPKEEKESIVPVFVSLGGGLRIPTAKFDLPRAIKATGGDATLSSGGGTYDILGRINIDYRPFRGFYLSLQHVSEYSLTQAKVHESSLLNPRKFLSGENEKTIIFRREGLRHVGFLKAAFGFGYLMPSLKILGLHSMLKYNIGAQAYLDDEKVPFPNGSREQFMSLASGFTLNGLTCGIPISFDVEFEFPIRGKNRVISPYNLLMSLSGYYKFN